VAALCVETAGQGGAMARTGGNRDQLVRLANGGAWLMAVGVASMIYFLPAANLVQ